VLAAERELLNARLEQARRERVKRTAEQQANPATETVPTERESVAAQPVRQAGEVARKEGIHEERLSLVHRYVTDAAIAIPARTQRNVPSAMAAVALADQVDSKIARTPEPLPGTGAPSAVPGSTVDTVVPPPESDETPAAAETPKALAQDATAPEEGDSARASTTEPTGGLAEAPTERTAHAVQRPLLSDDAADWPPELVRLQEALALSIATAIREHGLAAADQGAPPAGADPATLSRKLQPSLRATALETTAFPVALAVASTKTDFCHIQLWRGYLSSTFYVRAGEEVLESKSFRWRGTDTPPDGGRPRAAYDELVSRLAARGWQAYAREQHWFATRFSRQRTNG
jgi:hypothetical protein